MVISIFKFLKEYYGVVADPNTPLRHKSAKIKYGLTGCSFEKADKNPAMIKNGEIIYVRDKAGVILPYICKERAQVIVSEFECNESTKKERISTDKSILEELSDMPTYMVHELLSKYKNIPSFYKVIKKELICRGEYENKKYKLRKEIIEIEIEEGECNDKYQRRREIKCKKS